MKTPFATVGLIFALAMCGCGILERETTACAGPASYSAAAAYNAAAQANLVASPFGRPEQGWAIYAPAIGREVRSACPPASPGFAQAVAVWQASARLTPNGGVDPPTFEAMKTAWQQRRPFVRVRAAGICPAPPAEAGLATAPAVDSWRGAVVQLRAPALAAFERMRAAALRALPDAAADPELLTLFSGYRSPDYDDARCAREGNCDGIVRAACSAHRTGLALDLVLGAAPGFSVDSSADANRLFQSRTPAYRWLVANAARFGFVNYAFEPWHWEWTGQAP